MWGTGVQRGSVFWKNTQNGIGEMDHYNSYMGLIDHIVNLTYILTT